jgi:hypothetical protein
MKKTLLTLAFFILLINAFSVEKGDSLAIIYDKVWAYENPDDLSTRLGPYSYSDRKMSYIETSTEHPDYFKVLTPDGKEAFVKNSRVSTDQNLTHQQVKDGLNKGVRNKGYGEQVILNKIVNFQSWITWVVFLGILAGFYFLWRYFLKIDKWYCRLNPSSLKSLKRPWLITYPVLLGMIIGSLQNFIARTETDWFLNDGVRIWAKYPSYWDWIIWGLFMLFFINLLAAIIQPFFRFSTIKAIFYVLISLVLSTLSFLVGILSGGLAFVVLVLYLYAKARASEGSGKAPPSTIYKDGRTYQRVSGSDVYEEI